MDRTEKSKNSTLQAKLEKPNSGSTHST